MNNELEAFEHNTIHGILKLGLNDDGKLIKEEQVEKTLKYLIKNEEFEKVQEIVNIKNKYGK